MRQLFALLLFVLILPGATARAETPIFSETDGLAIGGYDTVAYFHVGRPVRGQAEFAVMWKGVTWLFSSDMNRAHFEANPRAFAPHFGGYCAFALSNGYLMGGDPEAWEIVGGKLYLTFSPPVHAIWKEDQDEHIARGQSHWPQVLRD